MRSLALKTLSLILPPRCPISGEIVERPGLLSAEAWAALRFVSSPKCSCCGIPFEVSLTEGNSVAADLTCGACFETKPSFRMARSALVYDDASRDMVLAFKHGDRTELVVTFAPWMAQAGGEILQDADVLIPVPLHWVRLLKRRYNQAALLAQAVSKHTGVACWLDGLDRVKNTVSQGHRSAKDRHENVRNVFRVPKRYADRIAGKKIVLIDDVMTTGATVSSCAKLLYACGADRVDVLTLARAVKN
jgi:ComF family protein